MDLKKLYEIISITTVAISDSNLVITRKVCSDLVLQSVMGLQHVKDKRGLK